MFRKSKDYDISINHSVENACYTTYATEKQILQAFISEACAFIKKDASKRLNEWAEYAQHYGVPTRFLDWTENPLVALYFACKGNKPDYRHPSNENRRDKDDGVGGKDGAVWMLHISHYRHYANQVDNIIYSNDMKEHLTIGASIEKVYQGTELFRYPIIYTPYYTDARMSAQSSLFMVWGREKDPLDKLFGEENNMRSNLSPDKERYFGNDTKEFVMKFTIDKNRKQSILRELDHCGINEKTLFPGLDGIGRYIEMKYRFDLGEAQDVF